MGRFERGLAKVERSDLEQALAEADDPMVVLGELIAEHRAAQTPLERYISDELHKHFMRHLVWGEAGEPLTLDELATMDGLA